jgi:hypothetical protein
LDLSLSRPYSMHFILSPRKGGVINTINKFINISTSVDISVDRGFPPFEIKKPVTRFVTGFLFFL